MDLVINNQSEIDGSIQFDTKNTVTITEYERNYQVLAAGESGVALDFGHVDTPSYLKIRATKPINITIGTVTINNVVEWEMQGDIPALTVTNTDSGNECRLDFLVGQSV